MIKKMSLYWKTWIITSITLLVTLLLFFLLFTAFATRFLEQAQASKFNRSVDEITSSIKKDGIDSELLDKYAIKGLLVTVMRGDELIFSPYSSSLFSVIVTSQALVTEEAAISSTDVAVISPNSSTTMPLVANKQVSFGQSLYDISVFYPATINQDEIQSVLYSIVPYFVVIGLIVSFVVSIIYSRYFSSKITKLNTIVHQMSTSSFPVVPLDQLEGDELQDLENNVLHMYLELQTTLQKLNEEMALVKRLEADRQVFMRGATHELKTPIMAMTTMLEGMIEDIDGYEDREKYLNACYSRLKSMSRLVNEMLEVSRIESIKFTSEVDLLTTTDEVLEVYAYMIEDKNLSLTVEKNEDSVINIPKRNLQKILSNLIGNAVKYTPSYGEITISIGQDTWEIRNQVSYNKEIQMANITDPFVSYGDEANTEYEKSHGLGLYIVSSILKQYDYSFSIDMDKDSNVFIFSIEL